MQEQLRLSIEAIIREHIAQDVDFDNAVVEASREIVAGLMRPLDAGPTRADCLALIEQIDKTLRVPAAEYVPAIVDVFTLIDAFRSSNATISIDSNDR